MAEVVHASDREVAIEWETRGPLMVVDRDGQVSEQYTPPPFSTRLGMNDDPVERALDVVRARARSRRLSEKTIAALTEEIDP